MRDGFQEYKRILVIDPTSKGFGFAVLEGPDRLIDWGVKEVRDNSNDRCINKVQELIDLYQPDAIILEDFTGKGSRRCPRVQELMKGIIGLATKRKINAYSLSRSDVREAFSEAGAYTKHEIAIEITKKFPELSLRLPPIRKCFMPEDYRMAIFDAMSFALAFYHFENKPYVKSQKPENTRH